MHHEERCVSRRSVLCVPIRLHDRLELFRPLIFTTSKPFCNGVLNSVVRTLDESQRLRVVRWTGHKDGAVFSNEFSELGSPKFGGSVRKDLST